MLIFSPFPLHLSTQKRPRFSRCYEEMEDERSACISWSNKDAQKNGSYWRGNGMYLMPEIIHKIMLGEMVSQVLERTFCSYFRDEVINVATHHILREQNCTGKQLAEMVSTSLAWLTLKLFQGKKGVNDTGKQKLRAVTKISACPANICNLLTSRQGVKFLRSSFVFYKNTWG